MEVNELIYTLFVLKEYGDTKITLRDLKRSFEILKNIFSLKQKNNLLA